jgi:hypothetical protein
MKPIGRRDLVAGGIAAAALTPISCLAQTQWVCPIIVAYRNGAPVRVKVTYENGNFALLFDKDISSIVSVVVLRDTATELVGELRDPGGPSFGFLKIDKKIQKCEFSSMQP